MPMSRGRDSGGSGTGHQRDAGGPGRRSAVGDKSRRDAPADGERDASHAEDMVGGALDRRTFERHAALLGDQRMSSPTNAGQRAALMQRLQRQYGNHYVQRLVGHISRKPVGAVQTKLDVGPAGDQYEQEADRVAKEVVSATGLDGHQAQRDVEEEEVQMKRIQRDAKEEEEEVQMKSEAPPQATREGGPVEPEVEQAVERAQGKGQSLPDNVREPMEQAFGANFSGVRVHNDSQSDALNRSLSARAFTTGQDVFFRQGEYSPSSSAGREVLAHELTHVVQQGGAGVQRQVVEAAPSAVATVVQRIKDFDSSGLPQATGLTPDQNGPQGIGKWHIHAIRDEEGLGLIKQVFIRFVDNPQGRQHLLFDEDGKLQPTTGLAKAGPDKFIKYGKEQVKKFLDGCTDVSPEEVEERRRAKEEKAAKDKAAIKAMGPAKEPGKFDYKGTKQAGLFG